MTNNNETHPNERHFIGINLLTSWEEALNHLLVDAYGTKANYNQYPLRNADLIFRFQYAGAYGQIDISTSYYLVVQGSEWGQGSFSISKYLTQYDAMIIGLLPREELQKQITEFEQQQKKEIKKKNLARCLDIIENNPDIRKIIECNLTKQDR